MSSLPGIHGRKSGYSLSPSDRSARPHGKAKPMAATYNGGPRALSPAGDAHLATSARLPPSLQYLHTAQTVLSDRSDTHTSALAAETSHEDTFLTETSVPQGTVYGRGIVNAMASSSPAVVPYRLGPSESAVAALKEDAAERWRSQLLNYETDLRELVATGSSMPPSTDRVMETLRIYDGIARIADGESPHLGEMLRLLRIEFSRAIFSGYELNFNGEDGPIGDLTSRNGGALSYASPPDDADIDTVVTYFDQVTSLLRENAALQSEIALGNTRERLVELTKKVEALGETLKMYEHEIGRLTRQNQHSLDECRKARQEHQDYKTSSETQQAEMGKEIQALNVENKDMQLQIFRLRKQIGGGRSKILKDTYRQMKLSKMSTMASMFDEGDERVGILIFLSQLESRVNELLDTFDAEYLLTSENAKAAVQKQFAQMVAVLLEEEHLCRSQYRRLVPDTGNHTTEEDGDETDGFVALLFDEKIYENFVARETIRRRLVAGAQRLRDEEAQRLNGDQPRNSETDIRTGFTFAQPGRAQPVSSGSEEQGKRGAVRTPAQPPAPFVRDGRMSLVSHVLQPSLSGCDEEPGMMGGPGTGALHGHSTGMAFPGRPGDLVVRAADGQRPAGIPMAPGLGLPRGGSPGTTRQATPQLPDVTFEETVECQKEMWVKNIFGTAASDVLIKKYVKGIPVLDGPRAGQGDETRIGTSTLMNRVLQRPLQDLSSSKFLSAFDVYTGRDPAQQKFLCSINFVSPAMPIQLPEQTNFVKVKYKSSIESERAGDPSDRAGGAALFSSTPDQPLSSPHIAPAAGAASFAGRKAQAGGRSTRVANTSTRSRAGADSASHSELLQQIQLWGGATPFSRTTEKAANPHEKELFQANENLRVFHELGAVTKTSATLGGAAAARSHKAGAVSSTTALTVAFQRLNPLSPNRGPEWGVYKELFGGYRTLTPRLLEVSTVDHIILRACERHYQRMTYRYETCLMEANQRSTNSQMALTTAERFFRDSYVLTDFQESIVDELESRYGYPELVAKNLYEILCYLDATAEKDGMLALYLDVVRGFKSPTSVHYTLYMLYQMSYGWPTSNPLAEVSREEVSTVLQYMYRDSGAILHVDVTELLNEYDMATRSAPITFMTMRSYLSQIMLHTEEPLLLYFNGLFNRNTPDESANGVGFEGFMDIITKYWQPKSDRACLVRFLATGLGFNREALLSVPDCANLALSGWCSGLW